MKKIFTLAVAALLLAGCAKKDLKTQFLEKAEETTKAIGEAKDAAEYAAAAKEFEKFCKDNEKEFEEIGLDKDEECKKAMIEFATVTLAKGIELEKSK